MFCQDLAGPEHLNLFFRHPERSEGSNTSLIKQYS